MSTKKIVSVVLPAFNEQANIPVIYQALKNEFLKLQNHYDYEFIFIDDGSSDNSWQVLEALAQQDARIRSISFSRNFGHQAALIAGYDHANGDAIVSMDADMQHPPFLLQDMIKKWEVGNDIVYARKIDRQDSFLKKRAALFYYKFLDAISDISIPRNVSDFRLIDKKVLNVLRQTKEYAPYLRGLVAWTGFKHAFVDCPYVERHAGTTGYSWKKMLKLAGDGIMAFSLFPLRLAAFFGFFLLFGSIFFGLYLLCVSLFFNITVLLSTWLFVLLFKILGILFLLLWILGEYVGSLVVQQQGRPRYVINKKTGK